MPCCALLCRQRGSTSAPAMWHMLHITSMPTSLRSDIVRQIRDAACLCGRM